MDVKDVELRGKAISKAMNENEPSSSLIKLLNDLKGGVRATEDLLRQTKIGVTINRLRTHKDPAVAKLATELVSRWRDEVNKQKKKAAPAKAPAPKGTASPAPPSGTASPAPPKQKQSADPEKRKHNVDPQKRSHKTDKVDVNVTGNDARDSCIKLLYDGLCHMTDELPEDVLAVTKQVELAVWAGAKNTAGTEYRQKIRTLFLNLKNKTNPELRKRVLSGDIPPKRFASMTHEELKSAERREKDSALEKENMNAAQVAEKERAISKEFQCGKCKKKMVSYSQAQTRSADEPMTTFCECMNCGNRWKFS